MNINLKIVKSPDGDDFYNYSFLLWGEVDPITGYSKVNKSDYQKFRKSIIGINEIIKTYLYKLNQDIQLANDVYIASMTRWIQIISRMVKEQFLPSADSKFAKRFSELELLAKGGTDITFTMLTNEYLIPWWLARLYSYENQNDIWGKYFSIGLIPALIEADTPEKISIKEPRIALISRPTEDLSKAKSIEERLDENKIVETKVQKSLIHQNGKKNQHNPDLGFFGLVKNDIIYALKSGEVIFYYGHFQLDEEHPGNSTIEATYGYDVTGEVTRDPIKLDDVKSLLEGKILFLNACRSIGLPFLGDNPFPSQENILPNYFLKNHTVSIGTIYPIFSDAAVDYMTHLMRFLLQGNCLGNAVRDARRILMDSDKYTIFDWAPYILIGNPLICIEVEKE
jgi:hypothetical protein